MDYRERPSITFTSNVPARNLFRTFYIIVTLMHNETHDQMITTFDI